MAAAHARSPLNSFHTYYIPGTIPERIKSPCGLRTRVSEGALGLVFGIQGSQCPAIVEPVLDANYFEAFFVYFLRNYTGWN